MARLEARDTETIRADPLAVHGIGPETADDTLLYALDRPVFVIDAYTRRLFARLGWIEGHEDYEALRARIESFLGPDVPLYPRPHRASRQGDLPHRPRLRALLPRRALRLAHRRSIPGGRVLKGGAPDLLYLQALPPQAGAGAPTGADNFNHKKASNEHKKGGPWT